jgi:hypothetical protein
MSTIAALSLIGALITEPHQVHEVKEFSNAVAFKPDSLESLQEYLAAINNELTPVILVNDYFLWDGIIHDSPKQYVLDAIAATGHTGPIVLCWDEPLMHIRRQGGDPWEAYFQMKQIQAEWSEFQWLHITSYDEMVRQYQDFGRLLLLFDAEYVAFNCYGDKDGCGNDEVGYASIDDYLLVLKAELMRNNSDAKIFLVPGMFSAGGTLYTDDEQRMDHYYHYLNVYNENLLGIGGFGVFTWGKGPETSAITQAIRDVPAWRGVVKNTLRNLKDNATP